MVDPVVDAQFDVVGVGNAIVDIIARSSEDFIVEQGLTKGSMLLIDEARADELHDLVDPEVEASGGSAANTVAGVASFGGRAAYIGKVDHDDLGATFSDDMRALGVDFSIPPASEGPATARCIILVTPDAQRTLNTYLGVSVMLEPADVNPEVVSAGRILFCEGYLWDVESAKQAIRKAMEIAADAGRRVSLTLSDSFCIDRHHREFLELVAGPVDVLFANKAELTRLYECDFDAAVNRLAGEVNLAFVTMGADGSLILSEGDVIEIAPERMGPVVDTTGAGDQYAAGALYGLSRGLPLAEAGRLGSLAAGEVISHMGPRPRRPLSDFLDWPQS
ncbi:MAG: adenosine kinase [Acidimicrobiia bacterium]|nr:adenosine kinase [Acidimicrobiia bacterium]